MRKGIGRGRRNSIWNSRVIWFILAVIILIVIFSDKSEPAERVCPPGSFCLEIVNVVIKQDADDLIFSVTAVCRKWRGTAHNLRMTIEVFGPDDLREFHSYRLKTLASGDEQVKSFTLEQAIGGSYRVLVELRNGLSPIGMDCEVRDFVKK